MRETKRLGVFLLSILILVGVMGVGSAAELNVNPMGIAEDNSLDWGSQEKVAEFDVSLTLNQLFVGDGLQYKYTVLNGGTYNGASPAIAVMDLEDGRHIVLFPGWGTRTGTHTLTFNDLIAYDTGGNNLVDFVVYGSDWVKIEGSPGSYPAWTELNTVLTTIDGTETVTKVYIITQGANTGEEDRIDSMLINGVTYYGTIQSAIDAASDGDTINVEEGTYTENLIVSKSLTLKGTSSATVTVTAASQTDSVFTVSASNVDISGFTATHTTKTGNEGYAGIKFDSGVTNCNIYDNILTNNQYGILIIEPENSVTPGNNIFNNNNASNNGVSGIEMQHSYGNTFTNNIANSNKLGFKLDSARHNTFTNNTANSNSERGFYLTTGSGVGSNDNTFTNNIAKFNVKHGIHLIGVSNNIVLTGNTFFGNIITGIKLQNEVDNLMMNNNNITNNPTGIGISNEGLPIPNVTSWTVTHNNILGNTIYSISNLGTGILNAENNWFGTNVGSTIATKISGNVDYTPWTTQAQDVVTTEAGVPESVDTTGTNVSITLTTSTTQSGTITIQQYSEDSHGGFGTALGKFITIDAPTISDINNVEIRIYYTDAELLASGIDETTLKIYYWNSLTSSWEVLTNTGVNTTENYVWAITNHFSDYGVGGGADTEGPSITSVYINPLFPNLLSTLVTVYATITDPSGVDYATLYYRIGDSEIESRTFTGPFAGGYAGIVDGNPKDGILVKYHIKAVDNLGQDTWYPNSGWLTFTYDGSVPVTSDNANTLWRNTDLSVSLICNDGTGSGCFNKYYSINNPVPTTPYSVPFLLSATGQYQLRYYSTDNAGNVETTKDGTLVRIDKIVPVTTDNYAFNDVWKNSDQTITLTETTNDGLSPVTTKYCVDITNTCDVSTGTIYPAPVVVSSEGTNYFRYASSDEAGNQETTKEKVVKIDKTFPITTDNVPVEWRNVPFSITLTSSIDGFSPLTTYYRVWNVGGIEPTGWTLGNTISISLSGKYNIKYYSEDGAGNVETEVTALNTAKLDMINPVVTIDAVITPTSIATQTVTGTFTEQNIYNISVNGVLATPGLGTYSVIIPLVEGNNPVAVLVTDLAGNTGTADSLIVLDTTAPTLNITSPLTNGTIVDVMSLYTVKATADDVTSGIESVKLTLKKGIDVLLTDEEMTKTASGYEYVMNMWELAAGDYTLQITAKDNAENNVLQIRTFTIAENVAPSRIIGVNTNVPVEGGIVGFRFNVTVRGTGDVRFGMDDIAGLSPSQFNARISNETTNVSVGGPAPAFAGAEYLALTDLDPATPNVQGSFVLYLDIPNGMVPGSYAIDYYIDN